jgi:hypothetical protein
MRKHNSLELPILVDDLSPKTISHDFGTRMSIDLASHSGEAFSFDIGPPAVPVPDLAVLEELESIRGLIERKSRDLKSREHSLSRSISTWNSEIATAQQLIEELANNLVAAGEKSMEEAFSKRTKKLQKLLDAVRSETKLYKQLTCRQVRNAAADAPPVPQIQGIESISACVLEYMSESPSSTPRKVSAATVLLLRCPPLAFKHFGFAVNVLFDALREFGLCKFDALMISSVASDIQPTSDEARSKFASVKQSILKKRLGVGSNSATSERIQLVLHCESSGSDKPVDIHQEVEGDLLDTWAEVYETIKGSALVYRSPLVKLFSDQTVQQAVCCRLRQRSENASIKGLLIEILLTYGISDKGILDALQSVKKLLPHLYTTHGTRCVVSVFVLLLYMLHRFIEDARPVDVTNAVCDIIGAMLNSRQLSSVVSQFLLEWPQGCWFAIRFLLTHNHTTPLNERIIECLCQILDSTGDLSCIAPWHAIMLDRLNRNLINPSVIGSIKSLLKRFPN